MADLQEVLRLHESGRLAEAGAACRRLVERSPGDVAAVHLLGVLAHREGRTDEAVNLLRQAVGLLPSEATYRSILAGLLGHLGRHAVAMESLREAIRLRPGFPYAHHNLGEALGQTGEAAAAYQFAKAHNHLGSVLRRLGQLDDRRRRVTHEQSICSRPTPGRTRAWRPPSRSGRS